MANFNEDRQLGNFILDSLPEDEYSLIEPYLQRTMLDKNAVLSRSHQPIERVYFPTTALVSWTQSTVGGETVEVGSAGFEGMVGTPLLLNCRHAPCDVEVIIAGEGYQISPEAEGLGDWVTGGRGEGRRLADQMHFSLLGGEFPIPYSPSSLLTL